MDAVEATTSAAATTIEVHPNRSLTLLSVAHALNHAQSVLLPLIFLAIIDEFGVGVEAIAFLAAIGAFASGMAQLSYAELTRRVSRRRLLGIGGILFGGGFAAQGLAWSYASFAIPNLVSRIGASPQHPVGNGLLTEQFPPSRRGFAISAHIAGGNIGTVAVALIGAPIIAAVGWRGASVVFGLPAILVGLLTLRFVRERGTDRIAAVTSGSTREAFRRILADRDLRWLYLTSVLGGGGRGLGVVNLFALIYLTRVIGLDEGTSVAMYAVLVIFSVPVPIIVGWLGDRFGRKPFIVGVYLGGALSFGVFVFAGSSLVWLWAGIVLMGLFTFAESPQLQALLADITEPSLRDATYALYFTLAFGVGSLWTLLYGVIIGRMGEAAGVPLVFGLMAAAFLAAALATLPIHTDGGGLVPESEIGHA
jgi:MFS family permease